MPFAGPVVIAGARRGASPLTGVAWVRLDAASTSSAIRDTAPSLREFQNHLDCRAAVSCCLRDLRRSLAMGDRMINSAASLRWFVLFAFLLLASLAGCAQAPAEQSNSGASTDKRAAPRWSQWLAEDRRTIGVVALSPTQMMHEDWFEFDPAIRSWLARDATYSTIRPEKLVWNPTLLSDAVETQMAAAFTNASGCGEGAGYCLLFGLALAPVGALAQWSIGGMEVVQPPPVVRTLDEVEAIDAELATALLDKQGIGEAIRDRLIEIGRQRTRHAFLAIPYERVAQSHTMPEGIDALLTVRVQAIDLIAKDGPGPPVALTINVWTNFKRTNGRPWTYKGSWLRADAWTGDGARLLREEVDRAVESLAEQIVDTEFPWPAASNSVG